MSLRAIASAGLAAWCLACSAGARAADASDEPASSGAPASVECAATDGVDVPPSLAALVAERRAKCAHLMPHRPGFLEKRLAGLGRTDRASLARANLAGFYPRAQALDHRAQLALGARFWHANIFGSPIDVHGAYYASRAGFRYGEGQVGVLPHRGDAFPQFTLRADEIFEIVNVRPDDSSPYVLYGSWTYRLSPRYDFFGAGPDSARDDRADFRQTDRTFEGVAGVRLLKHLSVIGRVARWEPETGAGDDDELPDVDRVFTPAQLPSFGRRLEYLRYGGSVVFDSRDVRLNPHAGAVVAVQYARHDARGGDPSFSQVAADGRLYVPLGHPQRVLALRAYVAHETPADDGARVPFFALPYLGSGETLRSYLTYRFRGERVLSAQAEYRVELAPAVELAFFYDGGTLALAENDGLGRWRNSGGVGLRLKAREALLARADFGWGREGFRARLRFTPSF